MKYVVEVVRRETYIAKIEVDADSHSNAAEVAMDKIQEAGDSDFWGEVAHGEEFVTSINAKE